jgi:hypothetical protein
LLLNAPCDEEPLIEEALLSLTAWTVRWPSSEGGFDGPGLAVDRLGLIVWARGPEGDAVLSYDGVPVRYFPPNVCETEEGLRQSTPLRVRDEEAWLARFPLSKPLSFEEP